VPADETPERPETVHARVYTFHVTEEQLRDVSHALDDAVTELSGHPDFRGLLYLERGTGRHEVLGMTLWADGGIGDTEVDAERSRQQIADSADIGICSRNYRVLRYFPREPLVGLRGEPVLADVG
jgi:hypothetical protein